MHGGDISLSLPASDAAPPAAESSELPDSATEAAIFWELRRQLISTVLNQALQTSRLRLYLLVVLTAVFWGALFWMFSEGFLLLRTYVKSPGMQAQTVHMIYNVFFVSLSAMLVVSSAIILYGGLYRNMETTFLMTQPVRPERIVLFRFQETVFFSGWGFLLLGSPMLVAYGVTAGAPWYYYALLLPFLISFVFIPAAIGAILCLAVVQFLPTARIAVVTLAGVLVLGMLLAIGWAVFAGATHQAMTPTWFHEVLSRLEVTEQRILPSWWLSSGLLEAAHEQTVQGAASWIECLGFLAALSSTAMLLFQVVGWVGAVWFRDGYSRLQDLTPAQDRVEPSLLDRALTFALSPFPWGMGQMMVKDLRVFRRDPMQWSQVAIILGLLVMYFFNLPRFLYDHYDFRWVNLVGALNLAVVGLFLSTFTTRFIFPMISLEGRCFWILGTLPIERDEILWGKFLFAMGGAFLPCSALVLLSDFMLRIPEHSMMIVLVHQLTCWSLCAGLCGLAVGLGARFPDFRESSPSKIAAGFGGTLNLVLSAMLIIVTVAATAVPICCWVEATGRLADPAWKQSFAYVYLGLGSVWGVIWGSAIALGLGLAGTIVPLYLGFQAFRKIEF